MNKKPLNLGIIYSIWALSFTTFYFVSLNALSNNETLLNYWSGSFLPLPPVSISDIKWYLSTPFAVFNDPLGLSLTGISLLAFIVGGTVIYSEKKKNFFILILPTLFTLFASGLKLYPFRGRLLLFLTPILIIFIAEGAEEIRLKTKPDSAIIGTALLALLFLHPMLHAVFNSIKPQIKEDIKPVINYFSHHEHSGDLLYLYYGATYPYIYYSKRFNLKNDFIKGVSSRQHFENYLEEINKLRGNKRVWLLFSHVYHKDKIDEEKFFLFCLNKIGTKLEEFKSPGASIYLYDLEKEAVALQ